MEDKDLKKFAVITSIVAAVMLFFATSNLDYGYYQLLRVVVTVTAILGCIASHKFEKPVLSVLAGVLAILFNPIAPVYLQKETWQCVDILSAVFFGILAYILNQAKPSHRHSE